MVLSWLRDTELNVMNLIEKLYYLNSGIVNSMQKSSPLSQFFLRKFE